MKIIGAGFGRTGTTSLKAALATLGFGRSYQLTEVFRHPEHVAFWEAARGGERVDWEGFLSGYGVAVDWPACTFYAEIMEAFPRAPVILTVRDPDRWYESVRSTIYGIRKLSAGPAPLRLVFALAGLFAPGATGIARLADEILWDGTFEGRFEDRRHAIETFLRHNGDVRRHVPPERLLVYDVKEGWEPLCDFLNVGVPDEPFPHLNDTREMRRRLLGLVAVSAAAPILAIAAVLAGLALYAHHARAQATPLGTGKARKLTAESGGREAVAS
ncbi:MAG TPA: sulfotransferase [Rubrobacter sp.]|nr:sulfotransferase [Rubrobacter sp.]